MMYRVNRNTNCRLFSTLAVVDTSDAAPSNARYAYKECRKDQKEEIESDEDETI